MVWNVQLYGEQQGLIEVSAVSPTSEKDLERRRPMGMDLGSWQTDEDDYFPSSSDADHNETKEKYDG